MGAIVFGGLVVLGIWWIAVRRRAASDPRLRKRWTVALVGSICVALLAVIVTVGLIVGGPDYSKPTPEFPSLSAQPDAALHGTVAYVVVTKDVVAKVMSGCARMTLASGSASKDVFCWPFDPTAPVTVKWLDSSRLLVTLFAVRPDTHDLNPKWAKIFDVSTGLTQDVPASELGKGAIPPSGPTRNVAGETVTATGKDGNLTLAMRGPSGTQTLLAVRDSNPGWGIQSGPAWSPDGAWILWSDGGRLLLTTPGVKAATYVLSSAEVFGVAGEYNVQTFALNGADLPLS